MDFLNTVVLQNTVGTWLEAIGVVALTAVVLRASIPRLLLALKRVAHSTSTHVDDAFVAAAGATKGFFYLVVGLYVGSALLEIPTGIRVLLDEVLGTAVLLQVGLWVTAAYRTFLLRTRDTHYPDDREVATSFNLIRVLGTATIWFFVFVFILQVWGINVTALLTGLGIGGIAIALAVQNILSDLFASLSIIFDKPFLVGDYLAIGDYGGTVEEIGLKTTLVRSISGEQIVFSNSDLLNSRIRNYGRMERRRADFKFGVVYETDPDLVAQIPGWVEEIIESKDLAQFDRCHFTTLGDWALEFETVYHMAVADYKAFADVRQQVNLALMRRLADADVQFAYPTQLLYERRLDEVQAESEAAG